MSATALPTSSPQCWGRLAHRRAASHAGAAKISVYAQKIPTHAGTLHEVAVKGMVRGYGSERAVASLDRALVAFAADDRGVLPIDDDSRGVPEVL